MKRLMKHNQLKPLNEKTEKTEKNENEATQEDHQTKESVEKEKKNFSLANDLKQSPPTEVYEQLA